MFQNLLEITFPDQSQPVVDRDAGVIRGVKVIGRKSRNNREYSSRAISQLVPMYEGIGVNLDHPPKSQTGCDRGIMEGIGWLKSPHETDDGVYADLHLSKSHPAFGHIMEVAERNPKRFGMSHNADGKVSSRNGSSPVVDEIEKVRSVDLVQNPATVEGLFESENKMKTSLRKLLESKTWSSAVMRRCSHYPKPTVGQMARALLEDDDMKPYAEDEVDGDGSGEDDSAIEAAILRAVKAMLGGDGALHEKMGRVNALCSKYGMGGSPAATSEGIGGPDRVPGDLKHQPYSDGDGAPGPGGAKGPGNPNQAIRSRESFDELLSQSPLVKRLTEALEENTRLKAADACRQLLESRGRSVDDLRLRALLALQTDHERQALVESWPEKDATRFASRPAQSFPLTESVSIPKGAEALARAIR